MTNDQELMEAWRGGSADAGNALFDRYFPALYRFFRNKVSDGIDDLVQTTFLACVEGAHRFREDASFRTFLLSIARHKLYDHFNRTRRDAQRFDLGSITAHDHGPSPSGRVADKAEQRLLLEALRRLPLANQIALELYHFEGMRGPEIAEILGVPEGTVRGRLNRALGQLRQQLEALAESPTLLRSTTTDLDKWARSLREQVGPSEPASSG